MIPMNNPLEKIEPLEPQGWFRWLHHHSAGRYGTLNRFDRSEPEVDWGGAGLPGARAWEAGFESRLGLLEKSWDNLTPAQRGEAAAGASESDECMEWVSARLASCELNAVTACELACNALRSGRADLLPAIFESCTDLCGEVVRYSGPGQKTGSFSEVIDLLSSRCIDLVLEAALIKESLPAIRLALGHGANPDIPVWVLERSYNERHCALSFCIEKRMGEAVECLLSAGANPGGIPFCTPNLPLYQAISTAQHDVAIQLLKKGASFADSDPRNERRKVMARIRKEKPRLIIPERDYFFGHFDKDLSWARDSIGSLIPLVPVEEKPCFYSGNGQGGQWRTFLDVAGDDVAVIQRYEAHGLDSRLSAEEFLSLVDDDENFSKLLYLLKGVPEPVKGRVLFRVRRRNPSFGAVGPLALRPQEDGASDAVGFDPGSQKPLVLPDGSSLFIDLDAIAKPGHPHGPCLQGHFWLLVEKADLRRRGERTVMRRNRLRWEMAVKPENIYQRKDLLPVIRCFDGHFIRLGCTIGRLGCLAQDETLSDLIYDWAGSPEFEEIAKEAGDRIAAQDQSNTRPPEPALTAEELDGYPKEFWPFLDRLESGLIGMRADISSLKLRRAYRAWEVANKREDSFVPDPRILDSSIWREVPPELKPFLVWDDLFDRPGFSHKRDTEYERAMGRKATKWWNDWITPQILTAIEEGGK